MNNQINNQERKASLNRGTKTKSLAIKTTLAATAIAITSILSTIPAKAENAEILKRESTKNDIYKFAGTYEKRVFGRAYIEHIRNIYTDMHNIILDEFQGRDSDEDKREKYSKLGYLLERFKFLVDSSQIGKFEEEQIKEVVEALKDSGFQTKNEDDLDSLPGILRMQDRLWVLSLIAGSYESNERDYFNYDKYKLK